MEVYLNVYDLHDSNQYLHSLGSGFYHTGVEVYGYEYSFSDQGVARTRPQLVEFGRLRDHLLMGTFNGSMTEVNQFLAVLRDGDFRPGLYNVTSRNCNHFSDAFLMLLLEVHVPNWVNRMANLANSLPGAKKGSTDSDGAALPAPGKVKDPTLPVKIEKEEVDSNSTSQANGSFLTSVFSWFTGSSSASTTASTTKVSEQASKPTPPPTASKSKNPSAKKELTEEQKKLLAKIKQKT